LFRNKSKNALVLLVLSVIFSLNSILDINSRYGRVNASREEIIEAAKKD
jgi:hypothetical protein